jgi:hypothetical protein
VIDRFIEARDVTTHDILAVLFEDGALERRPALVASTIGAWPKYDLLPKEKASNPQSENIDDGLIDDAIPKGQ